MDPELNVERQIILRIRRQERPNAPSHWEEFAIPHRPNMNITACLRYIAAHPVTRDGKRTSPVVYEASCLEEVCGACTMLVNGKTRQACSALVDKIEPTYARQRNERDNPLFNPVDYENPPDAESHHGRAAHGPITLEPLTKFPVIRDLQVNRERLFNDLKRTLCWVPIDGTHDLGPGPRITPKVNDERYALSRCISCGSCLEACPQYTIDNRFVGAAIFSQVKLFNLHPIGQILKDQRLGVMMQEGGIGDCAKAGNCVVVCPKNIPNLESIATVGRQTFLAWLRWFFSG